MRVTHAGLGAAAALLGAILMSGCGQGAEVSLPTAPPERTVDVTAPPSVTRPSPSRTISSPTPSVPSPSRPEATKSAQPTSEPTQTEEPTQSAKPTSQPTKTEEPTQSAKPTSQPTQTEEPTSSAEASPTDTPTPSPTPTETVASPTGSASPSTTEPPNTDTSGSTMWWALAGLLAIAGFGSWLVIGRSKRRRWDETLEAERAQAHWLLGELLPTMADPATAPSALAVHWANAQPTLDELDTGLASLVGGAPDEARRSTARQIADSVSEVRRVVAADLALRAGTGGIPADAPALAASALLVQTARDKLTAAITPPA